jgi:hypothetical protein
MRAMVLEKFGGLDSLAYKDIPEPKAGQVVIDIKAFGLSRLLQEKQTLSLREPLRARAVAR